MGKYRKRFNEKARMGMVKKQLELKRARNKWMFQKDDDNDASSQMHEDEQSPVSDFHDPNAETFLPMTKEEKAARKRELEEVLKPSESKWSSQKKKRLEKYIVRPLLRTTVRDLLLTTG
jgi:ATP-dependent RNA helicase DHX37/DHR1